MLHCHGCSTGWSRSFILSGRPFRTLPYLKFSPSSSALLRPHHPAKLSDCLHEETLKALEWSSVCDQVSAFTSTPMGCAAARTGRLSLGRTPDESRTLLEQTTAAMLLPAPLNFSGIVDVTVIVDSCVSGKLASISELCTVRRTLRAARGLLQQLKEAAVDGQSSERFLPVVSLLENCNFLMNIEQQIGFCIDSNFARILDRASEKLEIIRSERKKNMEILDSLLGRVSAQIFEAGGINKPLITKRRSRMCVGIRASHKSLLQDGIVLNVSSSGATYFIEPGEAVELNNMEVRLSDSERAEELVILSLLTGEIAESESEIKYLLYKIMEVDLACARAAHARWMNGVCPIITSDLFCEGSKNNQANNLSLVDVESIQHPLLLRTSLRKLSKSWNFKGSSGVSNFSVPVDIKIGYGTKVIVISGPNTGGKTASMKTLGLACLMLKAGMYVAAKSQPKIPWFDHVLADIGDHQSLEKNLSTFSGHISRICQILEVASKKSLVLIDEIGSGTDPSEGVALSASILHFLKDRVRLAVVTSHYADLTYLNEEDDRFDNAAMEFSLETLQPTYRILWGRRGDSNALKIANSIGFDKQIIEHAKIWMGKLMPENQEMQQSLLYESLLQERNRLATQASMMAALHSEIMDLYNEIECEAKDLKQREAALMARDAQRIQSEIGAAKDEMETVIRSFESQLKTASSHQFSSLIRKAESAIATIAEAHCPTDAAFVKEIENSPYIPKVGEKVQVKWLGAKPAIVVESLGNDGIVLVQCGKVKIRVNTVDIKACQSSELFSESAAVSDSRNQGTLHRKLLKPFEAGQHQSASYGPLVQTSKNTVDLRGMRVQEASEHLKLTISASEPCSIIFIIHGMGTGAIKDCALHVLRSHPRIDRFKQDNPMNYGCTVAYVK